MLFVTNRPLVKTGVQMVAGALAFGVHHRGVLHQPYQPMVAQIAI
jgi:hypothetical protein